MSEKVSKSVEPLFMIKNKKSLAKQESLGKIVNINNKNFFLKFFYLYITSVSFESCEPKNLKPIQRQALPPQVGGVGRTMQSVELVSLNNIEKQTEGKYKDDFKFLDSVSLDPSPGTVSKARIEGFRDPFCGPLKWYNGCNKYKSPSDFGWLEYSCYDLKKDEKVLCLIPTDGKVHYDSSSGYYSSRLISLMEQNFKLANWQNLRLDDGTSVHSPLNLQPGEYAYSNFSDWNWELQHVYWPTLENSNNEEMPNIIKKLIQSSLECAVNKGFSTIIITHPEFGDYMADLGVYIGEKGLDKTMLFNYILLGEVLNSIKIFLDSNKECKIKIVLR